jgi:hypothetical protein
LIEHKATRSKTTARDKNRRIAVHTEVLAIGAPQFALAPVVANPGRTAFKISASGLLLSSFIQNTTSSAMQPMKVRPRKRRKSAARTSTVILFSQP